MNDLAVLVSNQSSTAVNPFQNFDLCDMQRFYDTKKFLQSIDARDLLDKCILSEKEILHYDGTYKRIDFPHYAPGPFTFLEERSYIYEENYTVEKQVFVDTKMFIDKLDSSLYYWRELNPELVILLTSYHVVRMEVISNWVKMIQFMAPLPSQNAF